MSGHICEKHGQYCDRSCTNPNVDNGMMTKVWGPAGWLLIHSIAYGYPYAINPDNPDHLTKKEDYYKFFYYLGRVFPCKYCRDSYQQFFKELPIIDKLNTRHDLCKWIYDIHNKVNDKLGVPASTRPTFEEVEAKYESFRAKCTGSRTSANPARLTEPSGSRTSANPARLTEPSGNPANNSNVEGFGGQPKPTGCVIPANGTSSRSVISITQNFDDVVVISKSKYIVLVVFMVILI